jgi:hypothetical protein
MSAVFDLLFQFFISAAQGFFGFFPYREVFGKDHNPVYLLLLILQSGEVLGDPGRSSWSWVGRSDFIDCENDALLINSFNLVMERS